MLVSPRTYIVDLGVQSVCCFEKVSSLQFSRTDHNKPATMALSIVNNSLTEFTALQISPGTIHPLSNTGTVYFQLVLNCCYRNIIERRGNLPQCKTCYSTFLVQQIAIFNIDKVTRKRQGASLRLQYNFYISLYKCNNQDQLIFSK